MQRQKIILPWIKIETYWNVNEHNCDTKACDTLIKIETYWNVNKTARTMIMIITHIKIETYWNVNTYKEIKEAGIQLLK